MYHQNNMKSEIVQVVESSYRPNECDWVKFRREGRHYVTVKGQLKATLTHIRKINKYQYEVLKTGEVKQFQPIEDETRKHLARKQILKRTFDNLKALIRANFVNEGEAGYLQQLFITLTYKDNMTDTAQLYKDFDKWFKRIKYHYPQHNLEYIAVAEPQERGAWHFHVMLKTTNQKSLYIPYARMAKLWAHGMSETVRLKSNDIGAYYVAYFTDLLGEGKTAHKKGSRLDLYPPHFKFYRCSRGLTKPTYKNTIYADFAQDTNYIEIYAKQHDVVRATENGHEILNRIYKATYRHK